MSDRSSIPWTDATWNPITGCTPVSAACAHCYAARMVKRFPHLHGIADTMSPDGGSFDRDFAPFSKIIFHPDRLDQPLRWKKSRRIFVGSMTDIFHEGVKEEWIDKVMGVTRLAPQHTFIFLTKRPERMKRYFADSPGVAMVRANKEAQVMAKPRNFICPESPSVWPRHNIWLGVTAENQEMLDLRWPFLRDTPAARHFVSYEPGLGPLILPPDFLALGHRAWCIAGGETGPGARPMDVEWARSLRDQCVSAGVPFFFKGWGTTRMMKKSDPYYMRIDGTEWTQFP